MVVSYTHHTPGEWANSAEEANTVSSSTASNRGPGVSRQVLRYSSVGSPVRLWKERVVTYSHVHSLLHS